MTARIGSTTAQAPATRDANSAMRERPVAARSRKTPDSMSCVPAVAPMMVPMIEGREADDLDVLLEVAEPAGGPVPGGVAAVLDGHDDERHGHQACGQQQRDGEHAAPAAQLEHVGGDEREHQERSSRRVVMVRKRSSSEPATGATRSTATPWSSSRRNSAVTISRSTGASGLSVTRRPPS